MLQKACGLELRFGSHTWLSALSEDGQFFHMNNKACTLRFETAMLTQEYYVEFYKCIDLPEVLVLCYEDLQESVAGPSTKHRRVSDWSMSGRVFM